MKQGRKKRSEGGKEEEMEGGRGKMYVTKLVIFQPGHFHHAHPHIKGELPPFGGYHPTDRQQQPP